MDLNLLTVESTRIAIREKQFTASRLVDEFYKKIAAEDPEIQAYLATCEDRALASRCRHWPVFPLRLKT